MAFSRTWDSAYEALPPNSESAKLGASRIREVKIDVRERLSVDHSWAGDANDGAHKKVTLLEQAGDPITATNTGFAYTKDVGGVTELFYKDSGGNVLQLTNAGSIAGTNFTDASHGNRSGGSLHAAATGSAAGFMSASDKTNLDDLVANAQRKLQTVDLNGNQLIFDVDGNTYAQAAANDSITWTIGGTARHVFDGQHVGFGVTALDAWVSGTALQIGPNLAFWDDGTGYAEFINNAYYNLGWRYASNRYASKIQLDNNGAIKFDVAPSGIAGNAISWMTALTINNDGNISIGNSTFYNWGSLGTAIEFGALGTLWNDGSATTTVGQNYYYNGAYYYQANNYAQMISFDSAGAINFLVAPSGTGGTGITWTKVLTIDNNGVSTFGGFNSTAARDVISLTPTDYGANNPKFFIYKGNTASRWAIGLFNGTTNNTGVLEFAAGGFNFTNNGVWIGNPSGGNKGAGSLNAQALYYNGMDMLAPNTTEPAAPGYWTITAGFSYTIPAGIYVVTLNSSAAPVPVLRLKISNSFVGTGPFYSGVIISDGTNVQLYNSGTSDSTYYYRKIAP